MLEPINKEEFDELSEEEKRKTELRQKFERDNPEWNKPDKSFIVTKELLERIIKMYPVMTNADIAKELDITYSRLTQILPKLRKAGLLLEKSVDTFNTSLDKAIIELKSTPK